MAQLGLWQSSLSVHEALGHQAQANGKWRGKGKWENGGEGADEGAWQGPGWWVEYWSSSVGSVWRRAGGGDLGHS